MKKTFGGDFEFHFYENGKAVLAENVLKVDKNAYIAAETTTAEIRPQATNNIDEFLSNTREMLFQLSKTDKDLKLKCKPINEVNIYDITNLIVKPDIESYTAYDNRVKKTLILPDSLRTQAGHIWIAPECKKNDFNKLVKLMDLFVALPLVMLFPSKDEAIRRTKYGMAGSYREGKGLLEYRVLSSSILYHPEILKNVLFHTDVINKNQETIRGHICKRNYFTDEIGLTEIINTNDYIRATKLWRKVMQDCQTTACFTFKTHLLRWDSFIKYMCLRERQDNFLQNWFIS